MFKAKMVGEVKKEQKVRHVNLYHPFDMRTRAVDFDTLPEVLFDKKAIWYIDKQTSNTAHKLYRFPEEYQEFVNDYVEDTLYSHFVFVGGREKGYNEFAGHISLDQLQKLYKILGSK